ncbi:hypothetical protein ACRYCC_26020 [Actinomadura scrupuli]|uniref:hypothetical protein n=1 Tax=Actinomadura scrupuli TaxID=559629 RepID=UPI003D970A6A
MSNNHQPTGAAEKRSGYTEGLRALADLIDQNPALGLPTSGHSGDSLHFVKADPGLFVDLLGRPTSAKPSELWLWLTWQIAGVTVMAAAPASVCKQVVTGLRVVDGREVPVTETVIPERFRPTPAEAVKVGA